MIKFLSSILKKRAFSLMFAVGFAQVLSASQNPAPGSFGVRGEFLYFKPTIEQSYYAITSTDNVFGGNLFPNGRRHNISSDYHPAFRLEGSYGLCNGSNSVDARFTYFNSKHSKSVSGDFLFDTTGFPGFGAQRPEDTAYAGVSRMREKFQYYAADLTLNRFTFNCCPDNFTFLAGLHFAYVKVDNHYTSTGTSPDGDTTLAVDNTSSRNSKFWGIGPEFGIDYRYSLPSCVCPGPGDLALLINCRASVLYSQTKASMNYTSLNTTAIGVNLTNKPLIRVTPTADAKIGLSYDYSTCDFNLNFELGYEMLWYSNCVNSITGVDVAFAGDTVDVFSSLSLQGPYLAVGLDF